MKTIFLFIVVFLLSGNIPAASNEIVKETRNVSAFSAISLSLSANVYLSQGNQQKVEIEGDKEMLEKIEMKADGNTLEIKTKEDCFSNPGKINIYIVVPEIKRLILKGSGKIISQTPFKTDGLIINVSGSGTIKIQKLEVSEADIVISGSGSIDLTSGKSENKLNITITGSGSFYGNGFQADRVKVNISGSGSAKVWAVNTLETYITGSGSVYYKGNPLVNANAVGSGKTRALED